MIGNFFQGSLIIFCIQSLVWPGVLQGSEPPDAVQLATSEAAGNLGQTAASASFLHIVYDEVNNQVSIQANRAPLTLVLRELAEQASFEIEPMPRGLSEELSRKSVSLDRNGLSLRTALHELLSGIDSVLIAGDSEANSNSAARLERLILLAAAGSTFSDSGDRDAESSASSAMLPGSAVSPSGERETEDSDVSGLRASSLSERELSLLRDLLGLEGAEEAVRALESGEDISNELVDVLAISLLTNEHFSSPYTAIDTMRALAPETAMDVLDTWLQADDGPTRTIAATALGRVGADQEAASRAVGLLSPLLTQAGALIQDPVTRQMAANSLAKIGSQAAGTPIGSEAVDTLITTYRNGPPESQRAAAMAVALKGGTTAQRTLAELIAGRPLAPREDPQDVIVRNLPPLDATTVQDYEGLQ